MYGGSIKQSDTSKIYSSREVYSSSNMYSSKNLYSTKFMRNSKAVGVLWGIFSVCYTIIVMVVFTQDEWVGGSDQSKISGYFGLWRWCVHSDEGPGECRGNLVNFSTILSSGFIGTTILVGITVMASFLSMILLVLFLKYSSSFVFKICGSLQLISGLSLLLGLLVYPLGLQSEEIRTVCGPHAGSYSLGTCELRWVFVLAIIAFCDAVILASLAFTLASKTIDYVEEESSYDVYQGEINPGFMGDTLSIYGSRKSVNQNPDLATSRAEDDGYSLYSHITGRSHQSPFRGSYQQNLML